MIVTPSLAKTASNAAENLLSRSWMRKRIWRPRSSRSISKVARLLQHPCRVRVAGAGQVLASAAAIERKTSAYRG